MGLRLERKKCQNREIFGTPGKKANFQKRAGAGLAECLAAEPATGLFCAQLRTKSSPLQVWSWTDAIKDQPELVSNFRIIQHMMQRNSAFLQPRNTAYARNANIQLGRSLCKVVHLQNFWNALSMSNSYLLSHFRLVNKLANNCFYFKNVLIWYSFVTCSC